MDIVRPSNINYWTSLKFSPADRDRLLLQEAERIAIRRHKLKWVNISKQTPLLKPAVYHWLQTVVGRSLYEAYTVDQVFYKGDELPDLTIHSKLWPKEFIYVPQGQRLWSQVGSDAICFKNPDHAMLFKLTWG